MKNSVTVCDICGKDVGPSIKSLLVPYKAKTSRLLDLCNDCLRDEVLVLTTRLSECDRIDWIDSVYLRRKNAKYNG